MTELRQTEDINELMRWRKEVIETVFGVTPGQDLLEENERYYLTHISNGSHMAFIATFNGEEAGCGSLCLSEELPSPDNPNGKCGYLMNIYVREAFREKGVGHSIVRKLIEVANGMRCGKIYLETTDLGRSLYKSLGFSDLPDMMKLNKK